MKLFRSALAAGFTLALLSGAALAADLNQVAHKALYKMTLSSAKSGSSIVNVTGQMEYEWGDSCDKENWTTSQKFALDYVYADNPESRFNSEYTSIEAKDGSSYSFYVKRYRNNEVTEEYKGSAHRDAKGAGTADFIKPEKKSLPLPVGFYFPSAHTVKVLEAAYRGEHIVNGQMFDGTDGEGAVEVSAVIGGLVKRAQDAAVTSSLLDSPARKVRMAFYSSDEKADGGEGEQDDDKSDSSQPDYEMTLTLHDNGVVSDMQIDYDEFSIHGTLQAIEAIKSPKCKDGQ